MYKRQTLLRSQVTRQGDRVFYDVVGTGFLYNMVRIIVGTLLEIGKGKRAPEEMAKICLLYTSG